MNNLEATLKTVAGAEDRNMKRKYAVGARYKHQKSKSNNASGVKKTKRPRQEQRQVDPPILLVEAGTGKQRWER